MQLEEQIAEFHQFLHKWYEEGEYEDHIIMNVAETPLYFDMAPSKKVDKIGKKSIIINHTDVAILPLCSM